jgi:hypothetical protein
MSDLITLPRATVQQALEALEFMADQWGFTQKANRPERWRAIDALKAALEQPEQEPVAWTTMPDADDWMFVSGTEKPPLPGEWHPLYTHPPRREWRSLSEEEFGYIYVFSATHEEFACAIEAALRSKNHE